MLSSWPISSRKVSSRPIWASVCVRNPAKTSCWRACIRRSSVGQVVPAVDPRRPLGQHGGVGNDAAGDLAGEDLLPPRVPAVVERTPVRLDPLGCDVVRRVHGAEGEVQEERLARRGLLLVEHVLHRPVGQILAQVVPVARARRRVDVVVVLDDARGPVVGVTLEEAVVPLEAEPERPAVERARRRPLEPRRQVPLADGHRAVAGVAQDAREGRCALRQPGRVAREAERDIGQEPHAHGVVVPSGEERRPGRRTEGGDMEPVVAEAAVGERIHVRRGDPRAERAEVGEAGVVEDDRHDVRRAGRRLWFERRDGRRVGDGQAEPLRSWCHQE